MRSRAEKVDFADKRSGSADNVVGGDRPSFPVTKNTRTLPAFADGAARSVSPYPVHTKTCEVRNFQKAKIFSDVCKGVERESQGSTSSWASKDTGSSSQRESLNATQAERVDPESEKRPGTLMSSWILSV